MKTRILIINSVLVLFIAAGLAYLARGRIASLWDDWMHEPAPAAVTYEDILNRLGNRNDAAVNVNISANSNAATINIAPEPIPLPDELNLDVPFTTQSPFAEWTEQDNESCEEAASLIVHYYWQKKTFTKEIAKQELQGIVDFENEHLGKFKDTTAEETAQLIKDMWGYERVDVRYDVTIDDIKREVSEGRPVILPTAGRLLGNPNFRSPGPVYHMLVVRGWTRDMMITNDPGTRKGEEYQYAPGVLQNAIHDWNGTGDAIEQGRKAMIVVYPND
ncbi:MAG: C39 family peptidase [Patescibacteria group bacterium]|nr:C39 family peptidase [Patescibacteria group bacterium]MDD5715325.1 C39 family peptidase [Patescibacteria group bacterium]